MNPTPDPVEALLAHVDFYEPHAPYQRLAAIVRSLTQSVKGIEEAAAKVPVGSAHYAVMRSIVGFAQGALARAEALAKGE